MANTTSARALSANGEGLVKTGSNVVITAFLAVNETRILISEIN